MSSEVKRRRYDASGRRAAAARTRARVLAAARELFTTTGYAGTSVADIAERAGVSVDTLYATVGRKPQLLLAVHDMELAEADLDLTVEQRRYVQQIRDASSAREKLSVYADALARLLPRTVPLALALRTAGLTDPDCRRTYEGLMERRAERMRLFAADLLATGELRADLTRDDVAELVWTMNSPEYFELVTSRGRTPQQYAELVQQVWTRTLLAQRDTAR